MKYPKKWEEIDGTTDRLKVHGGWIVRYCYIERKLLHQIFVPDSNHEWVLDSKEK